MSRQITELDLSSAEQDHVRNALYFMRAKFGTWKSIARLLRFEETTLIKSANGERTVSASIAFRLARVAGIKVDDLVGGRFPEPGHCPRCGYHVPTDGRFRPAR